MTETAEARVLANRVLDRVNADPDDDLAILARQLLREDERTERMASLLCNLAQILDVVKQEWAKSWSAWDQEQRDGITSELKAYYEKKVIVRI